MKENDPTILTDPKTHAGFHVSEQPVVPTHRQVEPPDEEKFSRLRESKPAFGADLFSVLPRDPETIFAYWDLDWEKLFANADITFRPVWLRVLREDGAEETTVEIDPLAGQYFARVADAGANYRAELGCFDDSAAWKSLVCSQTVAMPESTTAENWDAEFATLPLHLTFQRLVELFGASGGAKSNLAEAVAQVQTKVRELKKSARETGGEIDKASLGLGAVSDEEFDALFGEIAGEQPPPPPSRETIERWSRLAGSFEGSSAPSSRGSSPVKKRA